MSQQSGPLRRVVGIPGAVLLGLGSILGTGVFVSIGIAGGIAGAGVIAAVILAGAVATFNGLSSAQLAAAHPVSGGTYEYGYRYLNPTLGFCAGWMFLCAKSASAATAALGCAGYVLGFFAIDNQFARAALGVTIVTGVTAVVVAGLRRSSRVNTVVVTMTLLGLGVFVIAGGTDLVGQTAESWPQLRAASDVAPSTLLHATALMFVAYTGYGRVATLGEEIRDPQRNIPRAIVITLVCTIVLYAAVAVVMVGVAGSAGLAALDVNTASLRQVAHMLSPTVSLAVGIAAITAMIGVLLNLVLGLSRVLLAMARRKDMPSSLAHVDERRASPVRAVVAVGVFVALLACIGDVRTTWSFSAFTVLVYYALTNLSALRLPPENRRFPRVIALLGLLSCVGLAFFVEQRVWVVGTSVIAGGLLVRAVARRVRPPPAEQAPPGPS